MNEEFPVSAGHKLALIKSLPFVHTARRYYRLDGLVARAAFQFKTTGFSGLPHLPLNDEQASHLLRAGNSPWQMSQFLDWLCVGRSLVTSALVPTAGSRYYQMSCLLSGSLQIVFRPGHRWSDARLLRLVWSSPTLEGLVVSPPRLLANPAIVPVADRVLDLEDYAPVGRNPFLKHRYFQSLAGMTLLNLTSFGPISLVRVDEDLWESYADQTMMNYFGHTFNEICYMMIQSNANRPWEPRGSYSRTAQIILSLFWLSYFGVIHQHKTWRTFYFMCNKRGDGTENWTLATSMTGTAQINPGDRHLYIMPTSPDWNMETNIILSSALTACLASVEQLPIIHNDSVPAPSKDIHGWTGRHGSVLHGFQIEGAVAEYCRSLRRDGVMSRGDEQTILARAAATQAFKRDKLETWAAEDEQYNRTHPNSRTWRTKPFVQAQWALGNTVQTAAALAGIL
uniref:Sigma 2 n=1 Tax=Phocid orthoreovirus 1 TaxID=2854225 RepID=A0A7L5EP68_9REOV|nr:Sigma 2 [Phocid orthoreovirus 1]